MNRRYSASFSRLALVLVLTSRLLNFPAGAAAEPPVRPQLETDTEKSPSSEGDATIKWFGSVSLVCDWLYGGSATRGQVFLLHREAPDDVTPKTYQIWSLEPSCVVVAPTTIRVSPVNGMTSFDFRIKTARVWEDTVVPILVMQGDAIVAIGYIIVLANR